MSILDKAYVDMMCVKHMVREKVKEQLTVNEGGFVFVELLIAIGLILVVYGVVSGKLMEFIDKLVEWAFGGEFLGGGEEATSGLK